MPSGRPPALGEDQDNPSGPRARRDLEGIQQFLEERTTAGVASVLGRIHTAMVAIGEQPEAAAKTDMGSVRVKIVPGYPYKVFYIVQHNTVIVLHIRHSARSVWRGIDRTEAKP